MRLDDHRPSRRAKTPALLILLLLVVAACAGCDAQSGSSGAPDAAGGPTPTAGRGARRRGPAAAGGTGSGTAKAPAPAPAQTQAAPVRVGVAPAAVARVFNSAASGRKGAAFTVTYRFTNAVGGVKKVSTWRLAQQPPKFRFERLSGGPRDIWIFDGKVLHSCTRPGGKVRCQEMRRPDDDTFFGAAHPGALIDQLRSLVPLIGAGMTVKSTSRTVAGE